MYGFNNENPLLKYLQSYSNAPHQSVEQNQQLGNINDAGIKVYEIHDNEELTYIKPDENGHKQIIVCDTEDSVYVARYNFATKKTVHKKYISEGVINLTNNSDNSVEMTQIANEMSQVAQALVAVADKLETMQSELQELKDSDPKVIERVIIDESVSNLVSRPRDSSGKFVKVED